MKDLNLLLPPVKAKALKLQQLAQERLGLKIIFTQTLRTKEEQAAFYAQGRNSLNTVNNLRKQAGLPNISTLENKSIITKANSIYNSFHGYGLAFDIAILDPTGKRIIWNNTSDWNSSGVSDWAEVGALAEECGLEWGGNFTSIVDYPHFQDRRGLTIAQLKTGKRPE